jgi:hypothetical protein
MAKITWTNKTTLNPQPSIARENKCTDADLNEIKSVVNTNDDNVGDLTNLDTTDKSSIVNATNELYGNYEYSTSETDTGKKWIDSKPIYRKVINLGSWTSNNSGNNDITITQINYDKVIKLNLYVKFGDTWYNKWDIFNNITIFNPTTLRFNISASITFADSFVILEYTKTTD